MRNYDFKSLSPTDFEYFVCDLLNAYLKLKLQSYPAGRDQGIDLRQVDTEDKITVVQCKHYAGSDWSTFRTAALKEAVKVGAKSADRYMLATSFALSAPKHTELVKELRGLGLALAHDDVLGSRALNDALVTCSEVERRHIKLWLSSSTVLEDLIHSGRWRRTEALLAEVLDRVKLWVEPPAYAEALHVLTVEGACIVAGPPGAGKTFLAELISLAAAHDGWEVVHVANAIEAWDLLRDDGIPRLFYYDDFLGQAELKITAVEEGQHLETFIARVRRLKNHKRLIMTSREQVLRQASQANNEPLARIAGSPMPHMIALASHDFQTRARILFNHLYFSELSTVERQRLAIDNRIINLVQHPSYNPRVVATVTERIHPNTTGDELLIQLARMFDDPQELLRISFQALNDQAKEVLLTLATFPTRPIRLEELRELSGQALTSLAWKATWQSLEPAWVRITGPSMMKSLTFSNPGCRDYLLGLLDDTDLAEERINRVQRLEQLISLSHTAGLLENPTSRARQRAELAHALIGLKDTIAIQINSLIRRELDHVTSEGATLRLLGDAAALLSLYGSSDSSSWLWHEIAAMERSRKFVPTIDGLSLAIRLGHVPAEAVDGPGNISRKQIMDLIRRAVSSIATLRDLDAYEALPEEFQEADIHDTACKRAAAVIHSELAQLFVSANVADTLRETIYDLQERAEWYGQSLDVDTLLDHADELTERESGNPTTWPESTSRTTSSLDANTQIGEIFRRLHT